MSLTLLIQELVVGLTTGAIYALIALGYTMVYGIIELINFAHGDIFMIGTLICISIFGVFGITLQFVPKDDVGPSGTHDPTQGAANVTSCVLRLGW